MTITLNPLSGQLLISILFSSFSNVFSYSFVWNIFLCLLILTNSLCLFLCQVSCLLVLKAVTFCSKQHSIPGHQNQVFQGCPLCGLHAPSCYGWATNGESILVSGVSPCPVVSNVCSDCCGCTGGEGLLLVWLPERTSSIFCSSFNPLGRSHFGGVPSWWAGWLK